MPSLEEDELPFSEQPVDEDRDLLGLATPEGLRAVDALKMVCSIDEEAAESMVITRVMALWDRFMSEGEMAVDRALEGDGEEYFIRIRERFLAEKEAVYSIDIPSGYAFTDEQGNLCYPNAMQRRVAWQVLEKRRVMNSSGVGSGKTLSAVLASRVIDARVTVIVANNATVREEEREGVSAEQETINNWRRQIQSAYPDSVVYSYAEIMEGCELAREKHNYIILNYEKFQGKHDTRGLHRAMLMNKLLELRPDFMVFDEVQFIKQRYDKPSNRREALVEIVCKLTESNPELCVLGMSATPVINNLQETRKLLEVVTGVTYSDVGTNPTINNALTYHRLLMLSGTRYKPRYGQEMPPIVFSETHNELLEELRQAQRTVLSTEQVLLPIKLEMVQDYFRKSTLVYTHYVDGMVEPIREYLESMGLKTGVYTGLDKSGLYPFLNREIDILIGSSPVGTGLDGLQKVCDRTVFLSLPWTNAGYEQVIGRTRRQGSNFKQVEVVIPQVALEYKGNIWSWDRRRLECIKYKRTLSDCVLDGRIPQTLQINEQEFLRQSRDALERWIARVEKDEMVTIERQMLTV